MIKKRLIDLLDFNFVDVEITAHGTTGHGSLLHKNTAGEKIRYIIDKFMDYRATEVQKLENNPEFTIGDVTTINLTILKVSPPRLVFFFSFTRAFHYSQ